MYGSDVLAGGWRQRGFAKTTEVAAERDLVVEVAQDGYCGAVTRVEAGMVELEDWKGRRRSFPLGGGFMIDGKPVKLVVPKVKQSGPRRTASGSFAVADDRARVALPSRIYVEGRHDAELIEKVWGEDLRHVGVVVEYLGGIDDLPAIVAEFGPEPGRRLGVLVDHLVPGSKESRIVKQVYTAGYRDVVLVEGHEFIDVWQAVKPARVGRKAWPSIPRDVDFKKGTLKALGVPHEDQADIARGWQAILARVESWRDLEPQLNTKVERLIDFVTQDHLDQT